MVSRDILGLFPLSLNRVGPARDASGLRATSLTTPTRLTLNQDRFLDNLQSPGDWPKVTQLAFRPKVGLELTAKLAHADTYPSLHPSCDLGHVVNEQTRPDSHHPIFLSLSSACGFKHEWVPQREEGRREELQDLAEGRKGALPRTPPHPNPTHYIGFLLQRGLAINGEDSEHGERSPEVSAQLPTDAMRAPACAEKFLLPFKPENRGTVTRLRGRQMLHQLLSQVDWPPAKLLRTDERGLQRCSERDAPALGYKETPRAYPVPVSISLPSPHPASSRSKVEKNCRRVGRRENGKVNERGTGEPSFKVLDGNSPVIPGTDRLLESNSPGMAMMNRLSVGRFSLALVVALGGAEFARDGVPLPPIPQLVDFGRTFTPLAVTEPSMALRSWKRGRGKDEPRLLLLTAGLAQPSVLPRWVKGGPKIAGGKYAGSVNRSERATKQRLTSEAETHLRGRNSAPPPLLMGHYSGLGQSILQNKDLQVEL
ncbi:hypothetical protein L345_02070, partial [Ophiophagus hannah]